MRTRARPPAPATGSHQPGIATRQPPHLALAAFDVVGSGRGELHAVPVQRRLADDDALSAYAVHTASAVFAIPSAPRAGGVLAGCLLEAAAA